MIFNFSARTDIVNHYGDWLMERFREGFVYTRNPVFPNRVTRYELSPEKADALLFCSKNYAPFLGHLSVLARDYRLYCQYTITAYGADLEPNVPDLETSVKTLLEVEKIVGRSRLVWRYDPVLCTEVYTAKRHLETFERLCAALQGHVDRCIFNFVEMYLKLRSNMPSLLPLREEERLLLAEGMAKIAKKYRIPLQNCGASGDFKKFGISDSACVTLPRLGQVNHCTFRTVKHRGNRMGCRCIESRDVGAYDSCPNGCRYCFSNTDTKKIRENIARHDVHSPLLIGGLGADDILTEGCQPSLLKGDGKQLSLFDF